MSGLMGYSNLNMDPDTYDTGAVPECERCGQPLWGTIQAEVVAKGDAEPIVVHESCVEPGEIVLRVIHDDESVDHKD